MQKIKKDFPIFSRKINGKKLVYLDNAATSQKPRQVIDAISDYYSQHNSNVHRGAHDLGDEATEIYEGAREKTAHFIKARTPKEIIFTKNATEALNIVAQSWALNNIKKGDEILVSMSEHNSNLIPWLEVANVTGAKVKYLEISEEGTISEQEIKNKLNKNVKLVAIFHASNVLGTILPIKRISKEAIKFGALVVVDGSQAVPHMPINVQSLGCDFYAFSAHKMLGPMGFGVLWGKEELLEKMPPVIFGGGMVKKIEGEHPKWVELPGRFEAGTPNVAGAAGLTAAIEYLQKIGMENIRKHEQELVTYAVEKLNEIEDLTILGPKNPKGRTGLISFVIKGTHSHDIGSILNTEGIAVRSGMHCAMKLHKSLDIPASTRASFYLYNGLEDIDLLIKGLKKALKILR